MKTRQLFMMLICLMSTMAACKKNCDESNFVEGINNPYFPLVPGDTYHYVNTITDGKNVTTQDIDVIVTRDTKVILGVTCEVIHDVVKEAGTVTEDTYDWYAQDKHGNVWYFGESTKKLENGVWITEGSWQAGVEGARQGIIMHANPGAHIGKAYYEEFWAGHAEDQAEVLNTNSTAKVPYGTFSNCVQTKNFTNLNPGDVGNKYYAAGVGQVFGIGSMPGGARERDELISITHN